MRYMAFIFLFFLLFPNILSASYSYVKISQTKSVTQLKAIKSKLSRLGVHSAYKVKGRTYTIYSGPYRNASYANRVLRKVKPYFTHASILTVQEKNKKIKPAITHESDKNKYFMDVAIGYSLIPLTHSGSLELFVPKEKGTSYDLRGGYNYSKNIFLTLGYLKTDGSDIVFDNYYTSANYKFGPYGKFNPYFGGVFGYSTITWGLNPLGDSGNSGSNSSTDFFGGTQIGALYRQNSNISLFVNYQCMFMNHKTIVSKTLNDVTVSSELKHKSLQNIQLGVRYSF